MHLTSEGLVDILDFDCCRHAAVDGNGVCPSATRCGSSGILLGSSPRPFH
jgi:hypothetical protein